MMGELAQAAEVTVQAGDVSHASVCSFILEYGYAALSQSQILFRRLISVTL